MAQQDLFGGSSTPVQQPRKLGEEDARLHHTWFFGLRPTAEDALRLHVTADKLLTARCVTGKRIDADRLHITLALVGQGIDDQVVAQACRAADNFTFAAVEARFDALMTFATPGGPVVLLGAEGLDDVRKLRTGLCCAMADEGFSPHPGYEPHMTLCYDRRNRLTRTSIAPLGFRAQAFSLIKSYVGQSRHEVIRTWPLGPA